MLTPQKTYKHCPFVVRDCALHPLTIAHVTLTVMWVNLSVLCQFEYETEEHLASQYQNSNVESVIYF